MAIATAIAACAGMTACTRIQEAALAVEDKVNSAYPMAPETRVAQERLVLLLEGDPKGLAHFKSQRDTRLSLRALTCSKSASIGRFDSIAAVRSLELDRACFQEQDKELQKFYGVRTIGLLLAQPPLRPLRPLGPSSVVSPGKLASLSTGAFARDAGVALVQDVRGDAALVQIPGGTMVSQMPLQGVSVAPAAKVSPNGRVVGTGDGRRQGMTFYEAETGTRIWQSAEAAGMLAWLPEVSALVLAGLDGSTLLADGQDGTIVAHPMSPRHSSFAMSMPAHPGRLLIGTARELSLIDHVRGPSGVSTNLVKQFSIPSGHGITSGNLIPMRSGKSVLFASMRDIGWLDLDSGRSGIWRSAPYFGIPFAKLDETHVMVDSIGDDAVSTKTWSFDIDNEMVAPVAAGATRGLLIDAGDRIGFMRRGNQLWVGDQIETGDASKIESVVADYEFRLQLKKLEQQSEPASTLPAAVARQDLMAMHGGEAARAAAMATAGARAALEAARATGRSGNEKPSTPGLGGVPADAQVHVVGVYEGRSKTRRAGSSSGHPLGEINVTLRGTGRPMVLVLTSYEPVEWKVVNAGSQLAAVLLSGYHASSVKGAGNVPVLRIGSEYAYSSASPGYLKLRSAVARYAGAREIRSFQGGYTGTDFIVGGN
ncbi:MAG: hypothetical protein V4844_22310 [Pseudomonadota bacterium]